MSISGVTMDVVVDTGSSHFAVVGPSCPRIRQSKGCNLPAQPINVQATSENVSATYGTDNNPSGWTGHVAEETLVQAGPLSTSFNSILIDSADNFFDAACDNVKGILGLGLGNDALLPSLMDSTNLPHQFALQLCGPETSAPSYTKGGRLWVGEYDERYFAAKPEWIPLSQNKASQRAGYYSIDVSSILINHKPVAEAEFASLTRLGYPSILDSGTTLFVFPQPVYNAVVSQLEQTNFIRFTNVPQKSIDAFWSGQGFVISTPCENVEIPALQMDPTHPDYPSIGIRVKTNAGSTDVDIDPSTLILVQQVPCSSLTRREGHYMTSHAIHKQRWGTPLANLKREAGQCLSMVLGIVSSDADASLIIFGVPMFQDKIVVHDMEDRRLALVKSVGCHDVDAPTVALPHTPVFTAPQCMPKMLDNLVKAGVNVNSTDAPKKNPVPPLVLPSLSSSRSVSFVPMMLMSICIFI